MTFDPNRITAELIHLLTLEEIDRFIFKGRSLALFGPRTYGGLLLAQALVAASKTIRPVCPAHSLHAYFLNAGDALVDIVYQVEPLRDGKTFQTRAVRALQHGKTIFCASISFAPQEEGLDYQIDMPIYPSPEMLISEQQHRSQSIVNLTAYNTPDERHLFCQPFHLDIRPVDFINPFAATIAPSAYAEYLKTHVLIPPAHDNAFLHQAIIAYYSDYSLMNSALRPHGISYLDPNISTASLDHSLYFHRVCRADEWMLYDIDANISTHGRGLNIGKMWQNGQLVCTALQENLMRVQSDMHKKT